MNSSSQHLAEIKDRWEKESAIDICPEALADIHFLLSEVDRLEAENERLNLEVDAYRCTGKPMEGFQDLLLERDVLKEQLSQDKQSSLIHELAEALKPFSDDEWDYFDDEIVKMVRQYGKVAKEALTKYQAWKEGK